MADLLNDSDHKAKPESEQNNNPVEEAAISAKAEEVSEEPAKAEEDIKSEANAEEASVERSMESLEDEIKKLRQENAKRRVESKEQQELAERLAEEKTAELKKKLEDYKKVEEELVAIKKAEEDKNRTADERIAHLQMELDQKKQESEKTQAKLAEIEAKHQEFLNKQKEEEELRAQVIKNRINSQLETIPEEQKELAQAMVNGYADLQDGYVALLKAKEQGVFGAKKVEVIHDVPRDTNTKENNTQVLGKGNKIKSGLSKRLPGVKQGGRIV